MEILRLIVKVFVLRAENCGLRLYNRYLRLCLRASHLRIRFQVWFRGWLDGF